MSLNNCTVFTSKLLLICHPVRHQLVSKCIVYMVDITVRQLWYFRRHCTNNTSFLTLNYLSCKELQVKPKEQKSSIIIIFTKYSGKHKFFYNSPVFRTPTSVFYGSILHGLICSQPKSISYIDIG